VAPDAVLLANWAFAYECVNDSEHALEKLEQSAAQLPRSSTYINMARHQTKLNREQEAIHSLTKAIELDSGLDPNLDAAYMMRARLLLRQGDSSGAARDYSRAILRGHIDTPVEGAIISGKVAAGGWALSKASAIAEISIYLDNQPLTQATIGIARPDVAKAFPAEGGAPASGWSAILDTTGTPPGQHALIARAKLQDGTFLDLGSIKVVVSR
jgi:tetratricopeptide (TPR) repeat protein